MILKITILRDVEEGDLVMLELSERARLTAWPWIYEGSRWNDARDWDAFSLSGVLPAPR